MQRIVRALRQIRIDRDQVLHRRDLGGQDDAVARQADLFGALTRQQRGLDHRLAGHLARVLRIVGARILVHQVREQFLIERAPIDPNAHRLAVLGRGLDDGRELAIALVLEADIAGIDAVLVERFGAGGMIGKELVADIVEVADQRHLAALLQQPFLDLRHRRRGFVAVDGDAHDLGAGARERGDLPHGRVRRPRCRYWSSTGRRPARHRRRSRRRR